jgi:phage baseplate assembly protein V
MDLIELSRRLENIIRIGTIHSVDHAARRCRVQSGKLTTQWLRWVECRAGETTTWNPPTIGEQCIVLSPSGVIENGMVFYGAPSDVIDTPSHDPVTHVIKFPDGAVISYDHAASHLEASGIQTAKIQAAVSITLDTPLTHINGKCVIDDLLTYNNGLCGYEGSEGNGSVINGTIRHHNGQHEQINVDQVGTGGKIVSNGIQVDTHHHGNVYPGSGTSGGPTP